MRPPKDWADTLDLFCWEVMSNTSDKAYNALLPALEKSGIKFESLRSTRKYLEGLLGISIYKGNAKAAAKSQQGHRKRRVSARSRPTA